MNRKYLVLLVTALATLSPLCACASVYLATPNTNMLSTGLIDYLPFDGNTTNWTTDTTTDVSGSGNTGVLVNLATSSTPVAGKIGQAYAFTLPVGTNYRYVFLPNALIENNLTLTISIWFKTSTSGGIVGYQNQPVGTAPSAWVPALYVGADGDLRGEYWQGSTSPITSSVSVANGVWHQAVLTGNVSTQSLYLDGKLVGTLTGTINHLAMAYNQIGIVTLGGSWPSQGNASFVGKFDDFRMYNRALSAQEIQMLYETGVFNLGNTQATNSSFSIDQGGLNSGLIGYWPLDGNTTSWTTGTTQDVSGNGNRGSLINMSTTTSPVTGKIGGALRFGGNAKVTLSDIALPAAPSQFTMSAWFKTSLGGGIINRYALTNGGGYRVMIYTDNKLYCTTDNGTASNLISTVTVADNKWHLVTCTFDGTTKRLYIDGVLNTSSAASPPTTGGNGIANIGYDQQNSRFFNGSIDDVRFYNRALSAQEIADLYAARQVNVDHSNTTASIGINSGLAGYWTFDGPTINWRTDTVADSSGQGDTGNMISMSTTTSPTAGKIGQALKFNGATSYIDVGTPASLVSNNEETFAFWFKTPTNSISQRIIGKFGAKDLEMETSNSAMCVTVFSSSAHCSGAGFIPVNQWIFVVGIFDHANSRVLLYKNGTLFQTIAAADTLIPGATHFTIGNSSFTLQGSLDDVRVYDRVLSPQEIQQLYQMSR